MTAIEWTTETWNPVTGCSKVSPGCDNCYMFRLYPRLKAMGVRGYEKAPDSVQLVEERLETPRKWRRRDPMMVFVNSMSDLFHKQVPYDYIFKVFGEMQMLPQHTFQVLTKRPGRAAAWYEDYNRRIGYEWPANVWIGVSVESQKYVPRIKVLERIPAEVRFVSAEPLLEQVTLADYLERGALQWVIVGGESGPGARAMDIEWARRLRDECGEHDIPYFLKQLGGTRNKRGRRRGRAGRAYLSGVAEWVVQADGVTAGLRKG